MKTINFCAACTGRRLLAGMTKVRMTSQDESESEASAPVSEDKFEGSDAELESLPSDERTWHNLWAFFALVLHPDMFSALFHFSPVFSVTTVIVPPQPWTDIPHLDKTHYIRMVTLLYICCIAFYKSQQSSLPSLSTLPFIFYFWPIFVSIWAEPPMDHFIGSFTLASSITSAHQRPRPDPAVPIISEIKWKARQCRL